MGDFYLIIENVLEIAKLADELGHCIVFEWPRYCRLWNEPLVQQLIEDRQLQPAEADGCRVGVKRQKDGKPIKKPWTSETIVQSCPMH